MKYIQLTQTGISSVIYIQLWIFVGGVILTANTDLSECITLYVFRILQNEVCWLSQNKQTLCPGSTQDHSSVPRISKQIRYPENYYEECIGLTSKNILLLRAKNFSVDKWLPYWANSRQV